MNSQENLAIEALCNLSHMSVEKTSPINKIETVNQKSEKEKKERKSYYVKKKDRIALNLPRFPMKPPMSYHQMPNTDLRCDLPRIICETLATDLDKFEALMNRIAVPDMLSVFQYDGKQNPYGPNYREVHGVQNFIDFYMAVMHGAPDCIFTIFKDSLRCSRNPDTDESFIVWRLMSIQTIVQIIQEKEPGEEERELGEILAAQQNTPNASNVPNSPTFTTKKQNSGTVDYQNGDNSDDITNSNSSSNNNINSSGNSNNTSIYSINSNSKSEQHAIETWNNGENYTVSKRFIRGNYVDCFAHNNSSNNSTKCSSSNSGKNSTLSSTMSKSSDVSENNSAAHTYPENTTTNTTTATFSSCTNIEPMDINNSNDNNNSNNNITSTIDSQQSHIFNSKLSSLVNNISDGSSSYSINNRLHNDYILKTSVLTNSNVSATKNNLSAVHSATYNTANNSGKKNNKIANNSTNITTHNNTSNSSIINTNSNTNNNAHSINNSTNTSNNSENNIEMDNLVSNFNSFKLSAVPTTERKTSYHYGTYIMELNADKKITKWYNFHKCLHHQPAFN